MKKLAEEVQNNLKGIKDPGAGKPFQPESTALGPKDTAEENHQAIVSKQTNDIESDQISESDKIRESGQIGESDQISDKGSEKEVSNNISNVFISVSDPYPVGSVSFGRIRIHFRKR